MLIDMHAWTTPSGGRSLNEVVADAKALGLGGILVADRHASAATAAAVMSGSFDIPVYVGVEIETRTGDVIAVVPQIDPFYTREEWKQLTALGHPMVAEVQTLVESEGGVLLMTHPYDRARPAAPRDRLFALKGLRAVELATSTSDGRANAMACESIVAGNLNAFGGSAVKGRPRGEGTWATLFADEVRTQAELVEALIGGDFWPVEILGRDARPAGRGRNEPPRRDARESDRGPRDGGRGGDRDRGPRPDRPGGDRPGGGRDGGRDGGRGGDRGGRGGDRDRGGDRRPRR